MSSEPGTRASRQPLFWRVLVPVVTAGAGILFATSAMTAKGTQLRSDATDLPQLVVSVNQQVADKSEQATTLQSQVDALTAAAAPGNATLASLTGQTQQLAPVAGTAAVRGPAVTVSLDDAHVSASDLPAPYTVDDIVVHQQDVQAVVNALWAGGAEAMMIMDQRVVSTSAVRCVGNTLLLQGRVYSPPYVITAIGDRTALRHAIDVDPQVTIYREWVSAVGLGYQVSSQDSVTMPGFDGQVSLPHARAK